MRYEEKQTMEFVERIRQLGFRVFLAKSKTHGFITDDKEERVLSFSFTGLEASLSGNYGPPSKESGTGWRLNQTPEQLQTKQDVKKALNEYPPSWCGHGFKYMTNVKQELALYGSSSGYEELK